MIAFVAGQASDLGEASDQAASQSLGLFIIPYSHEICIRIMHNFSTFECLFSCHFALLLCDAFSFCCAMCLVLSSRTLYSTMTATPYTITELRSTLEQLFSSRSTRQSKKTSVNLQVNLVDLPSTLLQTPPHINTRMCV